MASSFFTDSIEAFHVRKNVGLPGRQTSAREEHANIIGGKISFQEGCCGKTYSQMRSRTPLRREYCQMTRKGTTASPGAKVCDRGARDPRIDT